jgi:hypothetical protein
MGVKSMKRLWLAAALGFGAVCGFGGCSCTNDVSDMRRYADGDRYCVGNFTYSASEIKSVEIDWEGGRLEIEQSDAPELSVMEENPSDEEKKLVHYFLENGELKIRYCASGLKGKIDEFYKSLRVEIPAGISLDIENLNADVSLGVLALDEFSISTKTGNVSAEKITCKTGEIETRSGRVSIGDFTANEFDAESERGALCFGFSKPTKGEMESGGDIKLLLYSGLGAKVKYHSFLGQFLCEKDYEKTSDGYQIAGQEYCLFDVDLSRGKLEIQ